MRRALWTVALLVVIGVFVGFQQYYSWSLNKSPAKTELSSQTGSQEGAEKSTGDAGQGRGGNRSGRGGGSREAIPVLVAIAVQKSMPLQLRVVGNVESLSTVSIKSQVTGIITKVHFKEGQNVKKGDLLYTIDPRPLEAALKQAEAALTRDSAQLQNAREQARRYAELVEKQYVSREQYDQIRTNADALESTVQADKASVENAKVQLSYCYIYSPIDGQVGTYLVTEGNLVRSNDAAPLVTINQVTPIYVTFNVPEQNLAEVRSRMAGGKLKVAATFQSDQGRAEQGNLVFVDNTVDRTTGTIKLKAEFANGERRLWPGQYINVVLTLATEADVVVVPSDAIQVGPDGQQVFVVQPDKRVEMRPVIVARTSEGEAIVTKGVSPGEQVVTEGQFLLSPGARVDIKDANQNADIKSAKGKGEGRRKGGGRGKSEEKESSL